jgi:hypothetical protein
MSFPTTVYLSREEVVKTSSSQQLPVGTRGVTVDGRIFRYARNAATALALGRLCYSPAEGPWTTGTYTHFSYTYAAGTTQVYINDTATGSASANDFKDGWLVCNSTDEAHNQMVRVYSHAALVSAAAANTTGVAINLEIPGLTKAAVTDTALLKLVANPYRNVVVFADQVEGFPVGVTPCAVAASYYFWVQTWGPCLVRSDTGILSAADKRPGLAVYVATGGTGAVCLTDASTGGDSHGIGTDSGFTIGIGAVGNLITCAPADTFHAMVMLKIAA